jgi:hypothetical protein
MPRDEIDGGRTEHLPGDPAAREGFSRRSFLQIAAGATGAAIATKATVARAGNGWAMGLEGIPREKLVWMYETMLKSRWWEER